MKGERIIEKVKEKIQSIHKVGIELLGLLKVFKLILHLAFVLSISIFSDTFPNVIYVDLI